MKKYCKRKERRTLEHCTNSNLEANESRSLEVRRVLTLFLMKRPRLENFIRFSIWRQKKRLVCSYSFLTLLLSPPPPPFSSSGFSKFVSFISFQTLPHQNLYLTQLGPRVFVSQKTHTQIRAWV